MRAICLALVFGMGCLMGSGSADAQAHKGYETPGYAIEQADRAIEVRLYAPYLLAEVTVSGDRSTAIGRGFRLLAGYIFGGNADSQSIAMTSPVAQSGGDGEWVIQFSMPRGYTQAALPAPRDDRIRFRTTLPERLVVIRFPGIAGQASLAREEQVLRDWAQAKGILLGEGPRYFFYDAPMTLPWKRRNEIGFVVE